MIRTRRVYDPPAPGDGRRFLVDRLWPRGVRKERARLEGWIKEAAPSDALRRWFSHDPAKWPEFKKRYRQELAGRKSAWQPLLEAARKGTVTLLFAAKDGERNNAAVLKTFLESRL